MRIIFDNNIWISFLIGKRLSALRYIFDLDYISIYYCIELEREFIDVAHRPKIKKYVDDNQIERVHSLMTKFCKRAVALFGIVSPIRDPKDAYLLGLADAVNADYLISGDNDLTSLQQHNNTKIIDFDTLIGLLKTK